MNKGALRSAFIRMTFSWGRYVTLHRVDRQFGLNQDVARMAQACCNFSRLLF